MDDFSTEHLIGFDSPDWSAVPSVDVSPLKDQSNIFSPYGVLKDITIPMLNKCRDMFLETKDKKYWWQMIQLLPSSYNQRRTVMMSYEALAAMHKDRKHHKQDEWRVGFCEWIEGLPYSEIIIGEGTDEC